MACSRPALRPGRSPGPLPPSPPPPPPCPNTGQVLVQGAKVRKHRVGVFGQAHSTARHVPRNKCCRHKPAFPLATRQQAGIHPTTQEHKEKQLCQHFTAHMDTSCSPHNAANHILRCIGTAKRSKGGGVIPWEGPPGPPNTSPLTVLCSVRRRWAGDPPGGRHPVAGDLGAPPCLQPSPVA